MNSNSNITQDNDPLRTIATEYADTLLAAYRDPESTALRDICDLQTGELSVGTEISQHDRVDGYEYVVTPCQQYRPESDDERDALIAATIDDLRSALNMTLVTGKTHHHRNAIFEVVERTRNGWLRCRHAGRLVDGTEITPSDTIFTFRASAMRTIT